MKAKLTRRIYTFAVPKTSKKATRTKNQKGGVKRDVTGEETVVTNETKELEVIEIRGGTNLATVVEETVIGEAKHQFGQGAVLTHVRDEVSEIEISEE